MPPDGVVWYGWVWFGMGSRSAGKLYCPRELNVAQKTRDKGMNAKGRLKVRSYGGERRRGNKKGSNLIFTIDERGESKKAAVK